MKPMNYKPIMDNRTIKVIVGIISALFLGALGSGLWDLILRDIIVGLGNVTLTLISSVWGGYVDLLHKDIGKLHGDSLSVPVFAVVTEFLFLAPWILVMISLRYVSQLRKKITEYKKSKPLSKDELLMKVAFYRKITLRAMIPLTVLTTILVAVLFWQITYTRNASNWAERSVEILLPYVTAHEYNKLRSDLRAIENAEQFYALERQLQNTAAKASIKLPPFTVIRKRNTT